MSEIVYPSIMEIKQLSKQHGCKVWVTLFGGMKERRNGTAEWRNDGMTEYSKTRNDGIF